MKLGDGLEFFARKADPAYIAGLLESCTIWIDPQAFAMLPVWSPYTFRKAPLYKANWTDRLTNKGVPKLEGNVAAGDAQNKYLGLPSSNKVSRPNWSCCHLWGNDDPKFQSDHAEVNDPRFFTCPANMVLVPSPLKTFTDTIPEVKAALRYVAKRLYSFVPDGREEPSQNAAGKFLPDAWKTETPKGIVKLNATIMSRLETRADELNRLQTEAGLHYPRQSVASVVRYWLNRQPDCLFAGCAAFAREPASQECGS